MFEYKGKPYSLEALQKSATAQGYDNFDEFMQMYKDDGMIEISDSDLLGVGEFLRGEEKNIITVESGANNIQINFGLTDKAEQENEMKKLNDFITKYNK